MKTCSTCGSKVFDDMELCYECMGSFAVQEHEDNQKTDEATVRLHIALADYFAYELLLNKREGHSLSIGSGQENAIVIPQEEVAEHQLEMFYAHGYVWAETLDPALNTTVGEIPLCGTVRVYPGAEILVGDARITLIE